MSLQSEIPAFQVYYPSLAVMDAAQRTFYDRLCQSLDDGKRLDVAGNISYLFLYAYHLLETWKIKGYEHVRQHLVELRSLYPEEKKFADGCRIWSQDCLLGMVDFETYLDLTELSDPADLFRKATHPSNLRCNVMMLAGKPASPDDLLRMSDFRASAKTREFPREFRECADLLFTQNAEKNGPWLDRCLRMAQLDPLKERLFSGAPIEQPIAPFRTFAFYSVGPFLREIEVVAKEAQKMLKKDLCTT